MNNLVDGFLNLAESRTIDMIPMSMKDWKSLLDDYIKLSKLPILVDKGKISSKTAIKHVKEKYEKFRVNQDKKFESDFDKMIEEIKRIEGK